MSMILLSAARGVTRSGSVATRARAVLHSLFGVRLFYKILMANAAIVVGCVIAVAALSGAAPGSSLIEVVGLPGMVGLLTSIGANALLLRIALGPLQGLERTAATVLRGDLDARAPISPVADPHLERLIFTFNAMLDQLSVYRERLRTIAARALDTAEEERKRLARELHDDTAQSLATVLVRLRAARACATAAEHDRLLDEAREELADATERMRRFAQGLRPPALDMLGLVPAIEVHARKLAELEGLRIEIDADQVSGILSRPAEVAIYRIIQEGLSNVVRHARARRVLIVLRQEADRVVVEVEDDGAGFDPGEVEADPDRGLGLFGMEERASYIGGRIEIRSEPGAGCCVTAEIPIEGGSVNGHG